MRFVACFDDVEAVWQATVFSRNIQPGYIKNAHVGVAMDGVVFYPWYYIMGVRICQTGCYTFRHDGYGKRFFIRGFVAAFARTKYGLYSYNGLAFGQCSYVSGINITDYNRAKFANFGVARYADNSLVFV